jgi:hypothetical protein
VKPDNIIFNGEGAAVLLDLGSATPFGKDVAEGLPVHAALGYDGPSAAVLDLNGLSCALWVAAHGGAVADVYTATRAALPEMARTAARDAGNDKAALFRLIAALATLDSAHAVLDTLG